MGLDCDRPGGQAKGLHSILRQRGAVESFYTVNQCRYLWEGLGSSFNIQPMMEA